MKFAEKIFFNQPLKSTIIGLLADLKVFNTRTAFPVGEVVVAGTVAVVTSLVVTSVVVTCGADVVSMHSNSLQGQPAEQFSLFRFEILF